MLYCHINLCLIEKSRGEPEYCLLSVAGNNDDNNCDDGSIAPDEGGVDNESLIHN